MAELKKAQDEAKEKERSDNKKAKDAEKKSKKEVPPSTQALSVPTTAASMKEKKV